MFIFTQMVQIYDVGEMVAINNSFYKVGLKPNLHLIYQQHTLSGERPKIPSQEHSI